MRRGKNLIAVVVVAFGMMQSAWACPEIEKIPDFNCDGMLQITFIGDSLVYGFGDTQNRNKGGYVLRVEKKLKKANVTNLGQLGMFANELQDYLETVFETDSKASQKAVLRASDIIVFDVGRNDRWFFGEPITTYNQLRQAASYLKTQTAKLDGTAPMIVTAVLMLPNRGSQGPWVKALNELILKSSSTKAPADLRFDLVSKRLLGSDQIHPTSLGYDALAKAFLDYVRGSLAKKMRTLRPDKDKDGLPDILEKERFGTSAKLADTDGDGKSDGREVLKLGTDPLVAD